MTDVKLVMNSLVTIADSKGTVFPVVGDGQLKASQIREEASSPQKVSEFFLKVIGENDLSSHQIGLMRNTIQSLKEGQVKPTPDLDIELAQLYYLTKWEEDDAKKLLDATFIGKKENILNKIKRETKVTEEELILRIRQMSPQKRKQIDSLVKKLSTHSINKKIYNKLRKQLVGVHFADTSKQVKYQVDESPLSTQLRIQFTERTVPTKTGTDMEKRKGVSHKPNRVNFKNLADIKSITRIHLALMEEITRYNETAKSYNANETTPKYAELELDNLGKKMFLEEIIREAVNEADGPGRLYGLIMKKLLEKNHRTENWSTDDIRIFALQVLLDDETRLRKHLAEIHSLAKEMDEETRKNIQSITLESLRHDARTRLEKRAKEKNKSRTAEQLKQRYENRMSKKFPLEVALLKMYRDGEWSEDVIMKVDYEMFSEEEIRVVENFLSFHLFDNEEVKEAIRAMY